MWETAFCAGFQAPRANKNIRLRIPVKDVLQITKLVTVFDTFATTEEAVAHLNRKAACTSAMTSSK